MSFNKLMVRIRKKPRTSLSDRLDEVAQLASEFNFEENPAIVDLEAQATETTEAMEALVEKPPNEFPSGLPEVREESEELPEPPNLSVSFLSTPSETTPLLPMYEVPEVPQPPLAPTGVLDSCLWFIWSYFTNGMRTYFSSNWVSLAIVGQVISFGLFLYLLLSGQFVALKLLFPQIVCVVERLVFGTDTWGVCSI